MRIHSPYPASWALAQRIGYLYSEGEIIYLADTPFERLLDIQRQVGQCQTGHSCSPRVSLTTCMFALPCVTPCLDGMG